MGSEASEAPLKILGRYALHGVIASGGMATVHYGRLLGPVGFARTVAIKRLHERLAQDPEFTSMFLDEARLAARIRHPNVVPTLDVVALTGELFLVMEYVQGEALSSLLSHMRRAGKRIPVPIVRTIVAGALHGLHAAHEAKDDQGRPLGIIHRDVSPQNILVGIDGVPRVLDFGVAKAAGRGQTTRDGQLKGKLSYMAPEQLRSGGLTRAVDVYAAGIILWEGLTGRRLFQADSEAELVMQLLEGKVDPPSSVHADVPPGLDAIVLKALQADPEKRYATAREMAREIEKIGPLVPASEIGEWVEEAAAATLAQRATALAKIEGSSSVSLRVATGSTMPPPGLQAPAAGATDAAGAADPASAASGARTAAAPDPVTLTESAVSVPRALPRRKLVIGVVAAAGIVLALVTMVVGFGPSTRSTRPAPSGLVSPTEPSAAVAVGPSVASDSSISSPAPAPSASESARPAASAVPTPTVSAAPRPAATTARPAVPPPPPKVSCDPPYVIDAQGNRRYKRECLR